MRIVTLSFILMLTGFLTGCGPSDSPSASADRPPNIVIIFADDLGYGDLGIFGNPTIRTPNLDRMGREGMKFTQFYSGASVCTPSRAALMTGRLPIRNGMCSSKRRVLFPNSGGGLPQSEITIARSLKEQGYATACIGKWHLGHFSPHLPNDHGFDYYFGIPYSNDMSPLTNPGKGAKNYPPLPLMENKDIIENEPDQTGLTRRYTNKALDFIDNHSGGPFFIYFPHTFPHIPLFASDQFKDKSLRGLYGDVVEELDWSVGQVLDKLKEKNLDQNTLVVFTSDNGPWLVMKEDGGSAGLLREGKGSTWEGGMREPTLFWWPGKIEAGTLNTALATTMDLFPTALHLAGGNIPSGRAYDGVNLWPLLSGESTQVRNEVFYYLGSELFAVRKGPWKAHYSTLTPYVGEQAVKHDPPLLYHLEYDPSEKNNLAEAHPQVLEDLAEMVRAHQAGVDSVASQLEVPL